MVGVAVEERSFTTFFLNVIFVTESFMFLMKLIRQK